MDADEWRARIGPSPPRAANVSWFARRRRRWVPGESGRRSRRRQADSASLYRETSPGTGASPGAGDVVRVHYRGTLDQRHRIRQLIQTERAAEFPLNRVIGCWTEGLQKMKVGGKARLVCPSSIAYGDEGRPSIPGGATLIFEVELLAIVGGR